MEFYSDYTEKWIIFLHLRYFLRNKFTTFNAREQNNKFSLILVHSKLLCSKIYMAIFNTFCKMDSSFLASKDSSCIYLSLPIPHILCDCLLHPCSACQVLIKRIKMYNLDPYVFAMRLHWEFDESNKCLQTMTLSTSKLIG